MPIIGRVGVDDYSQTLMEIDQSILIAPPDDYLVDYLKEVPLRHGRVPWSALAARPRNALKRALAYLGDLNTAESKFFRFSDIQTITLGDLRDQRNVGERTLLDLVVQLNSAFSVLVEDDLVDGVIEQPDEVDRIRNRIKESENLEDLCEAMMTYLVTINEVSQREVGIWRSRLPWFTDNPETLSALASKNGVTRERIRQIQRKADRYPFLIHGPIRVIEDFQNLLLETSTFSEFEDECMEAGLFMGHSLNPGRIRQIAIVLERQDLVDEISQAIHRWSRNAVLGDELD